MTSLKVMRGRGLVYLDGEAAAGEVGYAIERVVDATGHETIRGLASTISTALARAHQVGSAELELESGGRVRFTIDSYDASTSSLRLDGPVPGMD